MQFIMKNVIVALLLLTGHLSAFHGFYAGFNVGGQINIAQGKNRNNVSFLNLFQTEIYTISNRSSFSQNSGSFVGSLYAGYGFECFREFVGVEGFVNFSSYDLKKKISTKSSLDFHSSTSTAFALIAENLEHEIHIQSRIPEYGIDFKPGVTIFDCALLYLRVGAAFNRLKISSGARASYSDESSLVAEPAHTVQFLPSKNSRSVAGLRLGLGMEYIIYYNLGFTLDYIFTNFGHLTAHGKQDTITPYGVIPGGLQVRTQVNVTKHAVVIGLNYHL